MTLENKKKFEKNKFFNSKDRATQGNKYTLFWETQVRELTVDKTFERKTALVRFR